MQSVAVRSSVTRSHRPDPAVCKSVSRWLAGLSVDSIRQPLLELPLDGLDGPAFFDGVCLDPILTADDVGYFEPWTDGSELVDGDIISFRWGPYWREFALQAYGSDLSLKVVKFIDGEPWLACFEVPLPLAGQEILGRLRAVRPKAAVLAELDSLLLASLENRKQLGTAIMLAMADMAMNGQVSGAGPDDAAERNALHRSGWQPYSVKLGDTWYSYNRLDPFGMLMGLSADMVEIGANMEPNSSALEFLEQAAIGFAAAVGSNAMSKTYISGLAEFFEVMSDPTRYSESYAQRFAGSFVPATSLAGEIRRVNDPYMREVRSMVDAIRNKIPGLSEGLPVRRDLWGRPISYQSPHGAMYDAFSPIYARRENPEPIDRELLSGGHYSRALVEGRNPDEDTELSEPFAVSAPDRKASFGGVIVDLDRFPGAYSRYLELAGNELKHPAWNLGAKDLLNSVVSGDHPLSEVYQIRSDGPDGGKEVFIRDTIIDFRERARAQLLDEFPELRRLVQERQEKRRELRMPVTRAR